MQKVLIPIVGFIFILTGSAFSAPGDFDVSFGEGGIVKYDGGGGSDFAYAVVVQDDGKIVVAGSINDDIVVFRYESDGTLDTSFGTEGLATYDGGYFDDARDVAIQSDGKIVVTGYRALSTSFGSLAFVTIRFNSDGSIDSSFGTDGAVDYHVGGREAAHAIGIQVDGKIVVGGESGNLVTGDVTILRYNADGTLDESFGTGGVFTYDSGFSDSALDLSIQPDGKIVITGAIRSNSGDDVLVLRTDSDGTLDASFGTGGVVTYDSDGGYERGWAIDIKAGKIIVAGSDDGDILVLRYTSGGSLDSDFGVSGVVTYDNSGLSDEAAAVEFQEDGKIVVAGNIDSSQDIVVLRYDSSGNLDCTFGEYGIVTYDSGGSDQCHAMTIQDDGKIIVAGNALGNYRDLLLMRLMGGSFDIDLDIAKFKTSKKFDFSKVKPITINLTVTNDRCSKPASVIGIQNGIEVYNETMDVFGSIKGNKETFQFPPYTPATTGTIEWTATIDDDDPDVDTAIESTVIK